VEIRTRTTGGYLTLHADEVLFHEDTGEMEAQGHVRVMQDGALR
jgi:lipopolysaccharide assembly outer membrane protein LptD (OstA)